MAEKTGISWTDATFNPWWGCAKVSPGCKHCYAETLSARYGHDIWGVNGSRRFFGDAHWNEPYKWDRKAARDGVRRRVFCGSMCDILEDRPDLEDPRARVLITAWNTPNLDWLFLTKRIENAEWMFPASWLNGKWPDNIWLGTSIENQDYAFRASILMEVPAAVRFISAEPLLGNLYLEKQFARHGIDWVIIGGESQKGCRPMELSWARYLVEQCREYGVAPFVKQLGGHPDKRARPAEWSADLQVQEFPR